MEVFIQAEYDSNVPEGQMNLKGCPQVDFYLLIGQPHFRVKLVKGP